MNYIIFILTFYHFERDYIYFIFVFISHNDINVYRKDLIININEWVIYKYIGFKRVL